MTHPNPILSLPPERLRQIRLGLEKWIAEHPEEMAEAERKERAEEMSERERAA